MFESISDFVDSVSEFEISIPFWLQLTVIIIAIVGLSIGGYVMRDYFNISYMRDGMAWFVFIAVLNLSTILVVFIYNNKKSKEEAAIGPQGKTGKKGRMGKKGKSITCSNCKNDLYIKSTRKNKLVCTLNIYTPDFVPINDNMKFFQNIINKGNSIDYDNFVNGIILGKLVATSNSESVSRFRSLMTPNSIAVLLIQAINDSSTKASRNVYGTIRFPSGVTGLTPLGGTVYGGVENFELNAFMVNGDIMYPSSYTKLITFNIFNIDLQINEPYTIWRPVGQSITNTSGYKGVSKTFNFVALGDMCVSGIKQPDLNKVATIKDTCTTPIKSTDLKLVFIYVGSLDYKDDTSNIDYTKSDVYLIENKVANNIEIFSVWRTPINTFITNCNNQNTIDNNTFIYNIYNGVYDALNDYGSISTEAKKYASMLIQSIPLEKILVASILCKHYEIELRKEIVYYFNQYQSKVPEFSGINPSTASFGTIMDKIEETKKAYIDFNEKMEKLASLTITGTKPTGKYSSETPIGTDPYIYDESKEKNLPQQLLLRYNYVLDRLLTISVQIENSSNLLDIVNIVFNNGIETRIAKDADGIAEGGVLMNEIQITVLMICKMLLPPTQTAYLIKDECLGTFALDRDREDLVKDLTAQIVDYNKFSDIIASKPDVYKPAMPNIIQYENLMWSQIGQACGHISDYQNKIKDMELEEFTTSRIKQLIDIYKTMNIYLGEVMKTV
jgi:hypothetical protein